MKATDLEPAERDPKAIRRTVIILIILMIGGGGIIFWKYQQKLKADYEKQIDGYESVLTRLTSNFKAIDQTGKPRNLFELEGKVWVVAAIAPSQPTDNESVLREMKMIAERYKGNEKVHLVCLSVEDPRKTGYEDLAKLADQIGADANQWWFLVADKNEVWGYVRDVLKLGVVEERSGSEAKVEGELSLPGRIRVVDQSRRVRANDYEHFNFDLAIKRQKEAQEAVLKDSKLGKGDKVELYLTMPEFFRNRIPKVIDYTLEEKEGDNDPDYITALMVVIAIVLFIVIQGYRLRKRANG